MKPGAALLLLGFALGLAAGTSLMLVVRPLEIRLVHVLKFEKK